MNREKKTRNYWSFQINEAGSVRNFMMDNVVYVRETLSYGTFVLRECICSHILFTRAEIYDPSLL